jgi:hypothetical protein
MENVKRSHIKLKSYDHKMTIYYEIVPKASSMLADMPP